MRTVSLLVENLGPVKRAQFDAAHINLICGKNNTGKSFLLHTIYLFLSQILADLTAHPLEKHLKGLLANSILDVDTREYFDAVNQWLADASPAFLKRLPLMLKKSPKCFEQTRISVILHRDYLEKVVKGAYWDTEREVSRGLVLKAHKDIDSYLMRVEIVNKNAEYPSVDVVSRLLQTALVYAVFRMLPYPKLMTAERVGAVLFGADVNVNVMKTIDAGLSTQIRADVSRRISYPSATIDELNALIDMRRPNNQPSWMFANDANTQGVYKRFCREVANGEYQEVNGELFFKDNVSGALLKLDDVSTSVKSLLFLDYYLKHEAWPGTLLLMDEPEMNLHPERQRALVRLLAQMANKCGIGVAISTHSDTIVRELNTLIALAGAHTRALPIMERHGYDESEILSSDNVACGIISAGVLRQMPIDRVDGFYIDSFDDTTEKIAAIQDELVELR